eukprot:2360982-Lingulodinium_polyedra.AAC.1
MRSSQIGRLCIGSATPPPRAWAGGAPQGPRPATGPRPRQPPGPLRAGRGARPAGGPVRRRTGHPSRAS